jgi:ATP-binding cassette subfamily F protein 3
MAQLTSEIARIDDDMANASISNPKALEGLTRARAKTQTDLDAAEAAWIEAEETLAEATA